jgi:hypothetical protein
LVGDYIENNDVLDMFSKSSDNFDILSLMFRLSDIKEFEETYLDDPSSRKQVVRGKLLMDKWNLNEVELFNIAIQNSWIYYDPIGFKMDNQTHLAYLICHEHLNIPIRRFCK